MSDVIYQSSDLASKRTQFLRDAKAGRARLRDKDGTGLVMLPEAELWALEKFAMWSRFSDHLGRFIDRYDAPTVDDLGENAWLRTLDLDDLREFRDELMQALVASLADKDTQVLDDMLHDWRVTARQLQDPLRRSVLLAKHDAADFEDAGVELDGR